MKTALLDQNVILRGQGFFGKSGTLLLSPNPKSHEWTLCVTDDDRRPIRPTMADTESRRMVLRAGGVVLNVPEHILAARFAGIIGLSIGSSGPWPPYHGRALEILSALKQARKTQLFTDLPTYTVSEAVFFEYEKGRRGNRAFTSIAPAEQLSESGTEDNRPVYDTRLTLKIVCNYPGLGEWQRNYTLPDDAVLTKICSAHAPGWPPWLYYPSKVCSHIFWPHHQHITWIQEHSREEARELFALHRAQDLLGALALLCRDGTFAGTVCSYYSGHKADVSAVKRADKHLVPLSRMQPARR